MCYRPFDFGETYHDPIANGLPSIYLSGALTIESNSKRLVMQKMIFRLGPCGVHRRLS